MADNNTVVLRVELSEGKTQEQLQQLVLSIEATKKAQVDLTAARKAGTISDEEFAKKTVDLRLQLKSQTTEFAALQKNLTLYKTATGEAADSINSLRGQLGLATQQVNALSEAERNSESGQVLVKQVKALSDALKSAEQANGDFRRNVGNYPTNNSLEGLIQQLVKLEEEQKHSIKTSEEAARAQMQIVGFRTQAMQAAAREGLTYEETEAKLKGYAEAIRPAVTNLVQLEQEQQKVVEGSEAFNQIGFKIGQANKQIKEVPTEVKGVTATLTDLDETTGVFGGHVANLKQQFNTAKQGIEAARAGFTGLKAAIAATGLGLLILTLASLYEYFTKTDEGQEDFAAGLAYLKGIVSVLDAVLISTGKTLVNLFKEPKKTATEFTDFIANNLINRVKAFGVLWESIKNGDSTKFQDSIVQFTTGIENATAKAKGFAAEMKIAAEAAASISRAKDELDDLERGEIVRTEKYRNEIDRLVLTAKDRTLTEKERLANLDRAGKLETTVLENTLNLARQRLSIIERENFEAERTGKLSDEQKKAAADAEADIVRLQGQSLSLQQSIQNRRSVLLQQIAADAKAAAADAEAKRKAKDEAMLQSIEADIAAGMSREAAAAKYLDEQLKGDQIRLASAQRVRDEQKAGETAAYNANLAMLERNLEQRRVLLETSLAKGEITQKQYEARLAVIDEGGYAARLVLAKHFNQDVNAADLARTRFHNAELKKQTDAERQQQEKRVADAQAFGSQLGALFAQSLAETGQTLEEFAGKFLILIIDTLEKQILAGQVAILANSLATKGIFGFIEAAALTAAVTAAFEGAKALISSSSSSKFADGTVLGGASHADGGVQLYSRAGQHWGEAEKDEIILTKGVWQSPILRPIASALNVMGGGAPLMPRTHMALGGVTSAGAAAQLRGEAAPFDYNKLAAALGKIKVETKVSNIKRGLEKDAYNNSISSF